MPATKPRIHSGGRKMISVESMITGKLPTFMSVRMPPWSMTAPMTARMRVTRNGSIVSGRKRCSTTMVPQLMRWEMTSFVAIG